MEPFRLKILEELRSLLEEITVANGCIHDLEDAVFIGRGLFGESDPLPMISILEQAIQPGIVAESSNNPQVSTTLNLVVQGFTIDEKGKGHETAPAYRLMAEVKQKIAEHMVEQKRSSQRNFLGLGPKITEFKMSAGVVRPADEISNKAFFWLDLAIQFVDNACNPYE